jgi:HEAT repeat protein
MSSEQIRPLLAGRSGSFVRGLSPALHHSDKSIRMKAAWAMGETGDTRFAADLAAALSDVSEAVRDAAEHALVKLGRGASAGVVRYVAVGNPSMAVEALGRVLGRLGASEEAPALIELVRTGKPQARVCAAIALGEIGDSRAVDALVRCLGAEPGLVAAAAGALGRIGSRQAVGPLVAALASADTAVRIAAVRALGLIGDTAATLSLLSAMRDPCAQVVCAAASAVGRTGGAVTAVCSTLAQVIGSADPRAQGCAAPAESSFLAIAKSRGDIADVYSRHPSGRVRRRAVEALAARGDWAAFGPLCEAARAGEYATRKEAIAALGSYGIRAVPVLRALTRDADGDIRRDAVKSLADGGEEEAVDVLMEVARRNAGRRDVGALSVCQEAVLGLGRLGNRRAVPAVREVLRGATNDAVRCAAVEALGMLNDTVMAAQFRRYLFSPDTAFAGDLGRMYRWDLRVAAARALGRMGDRKSVDALRHALSSANVELRTASAWSLGRLRDRGSVADLIDALGDEYGEVRRAALESLRGITGRDFGYDKQQWTKYYISTSSAVTGGQARDGSHTQRAGQ